jgi:hypothetical protein
MGRSFLDGMAIVIFRMQTGQSARQPLAVSVPLLSLFL